MRSVRVTLSVLAVALLLSVALASDDPPLGYQPAMRVAKLAPNGERWIPDTEFSARVGPLALLVDWSELPRGATLDVDWLYEDVTLTEIRHSATLGAPKEGSLGVCRVEPGAGAPWEPGRWLVAVRYDEQSLGVRRFRIVAPARTAAATPDYEHPVHGFRAPALEDWAVGTHPGGVRWVRAGMVLGVIVLPPDVKGAAQVFQQFESMAKPPRRHVAEARLRLGTEPAIARQYALTDARRGTRVAYLVVPTAKPAGHLVTAIAPKAMETELDEAVEALLLGFEPGGAR